MSANEQYEDYRLGTGQFFDRVFIVEAPTRDGVACDPIFDDELLTKAAPGTGVWDRPFAIAGLPRVSWSDGTTHTVVVPYSAPNLLTPGFGGEWQLSISASPDSERMDVTRPTAREIEEGIDPVIVGPYLYQVGVPVASSPSGLPWQEYTAGDLDLMLDPATKAKRKAYGMDVLTSNCQYTYRRQFIDNRPTRIVELDARHVCVNEDEVSLPKTGLLFRPRQLILWAWTVDEATGTEPNNPVVHNVSVTFASKYVGWQFDYYHTFTDPNAISVGAAIVKIRGNQTPMPGGTDPAPEGTAVGERFRRQFEIYFNGWLEGLQ